MDPGLKGDLLIRILLVVEAALRGGSRCHLIAARGSRAMRCRLCSPFRCNLPRVQVHEVAPLILIAAQVKKHPHRIALTVIIELRALVAGELEFDLLRIAVVGGDDEIALAEAGGKRLLLLDFENGSFKFV
jgi:hypothetical protein